MRTNPGTLNPTTPNTYLAEEEVVDHAHDVVLVLRVAAAVEQLQQPDLDARLPHGRGTPGGGGAFPSCV